MSTEINDTIFEIRSELATIENKISELLARIPEVAGDTQAKSKLIGVVISQHAALIRLKKQLAKLGINPS